MVMYRTSVVGLIMRRWAFYRVQFHVVFIASVLSMVLLAILLFQIRSFYQESWNPQYFPVGQLGYPRQISPLTQPMYSADEVIRRSRDAIETAFSLDYVHYRGQLQSLRNVFTSYGWKGYASRALVYSGFISKLRQQQQVIYPQFLNEPGVVRVGIESGVYVWYVRASILVHYVQTRSGAVSLQPLDILVKMTRVLPFNHPDGIAVDFIQASDT